MVEDGMSSPDRPVAFHVQGDAGVLPADVATPASVVLNELLQNAIDHAFPEGTDLQGRAGSVTVSMRNDGRHLACTVTDDGVGLPEGFDFEAATGLGLSIVRTLVTSELMGTITLERGHGPADRPGTVVELVIPVSRAE
jgi:two-component sensor histidine kinase